jgi:hypothetical protein
MSNDKIPCIEVYRDVEIHDGQTLERIAQVVKPEIDRVFEHVRDIEWLVKWSCNWLNCPESRLLAHAMIKATFESRVDSRMARGDIDLERVAAGVGGCGSNRSRDRRRYCSIYDCWQRSPGAQLPPLRPEPLPDRYPQREN